MGVRQQAYWIRQADALSRQNIALIAHAVNIGMAGDVEGCQRAVDALELAVTEKESKAQRSQATWDMLVAIGGGKSV